VQIVTSCSTIRSDGFSEGWRPIDEVGIPRFLIRETASDFGFVSRELLFALRAQVPETGDSLHPTNPRLLRLIATTLASTYTFGSIYNGRSPREIPLAFFLHSEPRSFR
jgi:hypothetical protein